MARQTNGSLYSKPQLKTLQSRPFSLCAREYRFKGADGRAAMRDGAIRFFREFSWKIVQLSDGRCVYFTPVGSDSDDARMEVVTRLDAFGNADANLAEVTVVATHRRKKGIPPSTIRRPLTEVVEAVAKHQAAGFSPSTTESSIANASLERKGGGILEVPQFYFGLPNLCDPLRGFGKTPTVDVLATAPRLRTFQP